MPLMLTLPFTVRVPSPCVLVDSTQGNTETTARTHTPGMTMTVTSLDIGTVSEPSTSVPSSALTVVSVIVVVVGDGARIAFDVSALCDVSATAVAGVGTGVGAAVAHAGIGDKHDAVELTHAPVPSAHHIHRPVVWRVSQRTYVPCDHKHTHHLTVQRTAGRACKPHTDCRAAADECTRVK
jgi:hypothetical protein